MFFNFLSFTRKKTTNDVAILQIVNGSYRNTNDEKLINTDEIKEVYE